MHSAASDRPAKHRKDMDELLEGSVGRIVGATGIFPRIGAFGPRGKARATVDIGRISAIR
jgi:hypothetical protein